MNSKLLFPVLIFFSFLFVSCEADIDLSNISDEVSLHPYLLIPIGDASFTLGELISNNDTEGNFEIGNDGELNYLSVDSLEFKFPNFNFLENSQELIQLQYPSPNMAVVIPSNTKIPTIVSYNSINLGINSNKNGDRIDSIKVKSATISVIINTSTDLRSINPSDIVFTLIFPNGKIRKLDGSSSDFSFSPDGLGLIKYFQIENFMISTSSQESGIPIEIRVDIKDNKQPLFLTPATSITSKIKFTQLNYSVVYGNFKTNFNLANSVKQKIGLDYDMPMGSFKFANPQVLISTTSNIGTYLNFNIDYIKAFLSTNENLYPVFASFNGIKSTTFDLKRKPAFPGDTIKIKLPTLDKDWGGTNKFFENETMPDILEYNFSASVDSALNKQFKSASFITSDAKIKVNIKTIIPLSFTKGSYYEVKDSVLNINNLISDDLNHGLLTNITSAELILDIANGLPVKSTFSFALIDSLGNEIPMSMETKYIIDAGKVDVNGLVQSGKETKQLLQIKMNKVQLDTMRKARIMTYKVRIEGGDVNSNIHFTKLNSFNLKVGLYVKGDVNTTLGINNK